MELSKDYLIKSLSRKIQILTETYQESLYSVKVTLSALHRVRRKKRCRKEGSWTSKGHFRKQEKELNKENLSESNEKRTCHKR